MKCGWLGVRYPNHPIVPPRSILANRNEAALIGVAAKINDRCMFMHAQTASWNDVSDLNYFSISKDTAVTELNAAEIDDVSGGIPPLVIGAWIAVVAAGVGYAVGRWG